MKEPSDNEVGARDDGAPDATPGKAHSPAPPPAPVLCALIDTDNLFLGMVERPPEDALTALHLVQVTASNARPGKARWEADAGLPQGGEFVPLTCALIDERMVFMGIVDTPPRGERNARHLLSIEECDLPAGQFQWQPGENQYGGQMVPMAREARTNPTLYTDQLALAFHLLAVYLRDPALTPDVTLAWLDAVVLTHDFQTYRKTPLLVAYAAARGIDFGGK